MVYADVEAIEQVILNVLTNAMRYTNEGGKIQIVLEDNKENVRIKVKDNGIGIPQKDLPRVFERFYRVDKARTRERGGTGLGLSIAKKMIESNNGEIYIDSEFGKWTEVTIVIPKSEICLSQPALINN
jgi:two-component system sensor histidine kinase VicK